MTRSRCIVYTPPASWIIETSVVINGRHVEAGTELSIAGEPGRFRFIRQITNGDATWIDVVGGKKGHEATRSFRPERVKTVHRLVKTRPSRKKAAA